MNSLYHKRIIIIISLMLFGLVDYAQNVVPKKGYSKLHIGISTKELIAILGSPDDISTRRQEESAWTSGGYILATKVVFHIGFDQVYKYNSDNKYGLWKAYVKNDTVIYMSLTTYSTSSGASAKITIDNKIKFGDNVKKVISHMGEDYYTKVDERDYTEIIYMKVGLRFIFTTDELNHVYIFKPLPKSEERIYLDHF